MEKPSKSIPKPNKTMKKYQKWSKAITLIILLSLLSRANSSNPVPQETPESSNQAKSETSPDKKLQKDYSKCVYNQAHITLGKHYANRTSDEIFTIAVVEMGEACPIPSLQFDSSSTLHYPDHIQDYSYQTQNPELLTYIRKAHFWYVNRSHTQSHSTWRIILTANRAAVLNSTDEIIRNITEDNTFPQRVLNYQETIKLAIIADMDMTRVAKPTYDEMLKYNSSDLDLVIHVGDMAYDIHSDNGTRGDYFFNNMSNITEKIPYLMVGGNHEFMDRGAFLNYRFMMPGAIEHDRHRNRWYSLDYRTVHMIFIDFDFIFDFYQNTRDECFEWAYKDLLAYEKDHRTSWLVLMVHRPFYCNDILQTKDCTKNFFQLRRFEALFRKFKVRSSTLLPISPLFFSIHPKIREKKQIFYFCYFY